MALKSLIIVKLIHYFYIQTVQEFERISLFHPVHGQKRRRQLAECGKIDGVKRPTIVCRMPFGFAGAFRVFFSANDDDQRQICAW